MNGWTPPPVKTKPSAEQLPATAHDTEPASDSWPLMPGITCTGPQVPFVSLTVNATGTPAAPEYPPAEQLPGVAQATDRTSAFTVVALVSRASPRALPQVPFFSSATNGRRFPAASVYEPTAAQVPGVAHDTELTRAFPPAFSAFSPGIDRAAVSCGAAALAAGPTP